MSYNQNIPLGTDFLSQSFGQLRANFQAINAAFAKNHVALKDANAGKHIVLTMQHQLSDPATSASQIAIYNKIVGSVPQLFFRPNNSQTPIQLTYSSLKTGLQSTNPDVYYPDQYTFVAGPFIFYAGIVKLATSGQSVTLTPSSTLIHVNLTNANAQGKGNTINQYSIPINITGSTFTIYTNAAGKFDVYYFAVGK